jgi:fumarylacetoacetase
VSGYCVFNRGGGPPCVGYKRGDSVADLSELDEVFRQPSLNEFMAQGRAVEREARAAAESARSVPLEAVELHLPFEVADYVDFYSSIEHATNLGRLFRPDSDPLLPNWRRLPVGYHGRAGTIVASGTPVQRPSGQSKPPDADEPVFGPSTRLDIELELGYVIGTPSALGESVPVGEALDHVFGVVVVNDWSARDIQAWEYQPLGPFLGKSFATTISACVTPIDLLEPVRVAGQQQEPEPLPYLRAEPSAYDIDLEVELNGEVVSRTSARHLYWSIEQQIAHLTVNGASLRTGDLLATGTISGPDPGSYGSLIELSWNGAEPLAGGRTFLEDGDEVVLRGRAGDVELSEARGTIVPA